MQKVSDSYVKGFAEIAEKCNSISFSISSSQNNQTAVDKIKSLANGEPSESALISIKELCYEILESDSYDSGCIELLDIAIIHLAFIC